MANQPEQMSYGPTVASTLIPMLRKEIESFTKWQLETLDIINQELRHFGWEFIIEQKAVKITDPVSKQELIVNRNILEVVQLVDKPSINKEGVQAVFGHLFSILNKNTILAKLDRNEVAQIWEDHNLTILMVIAMDFDFYDIESLGTMEKILNLNMATSSSVLSRGREGATMSYLQPIIKFAEELTGQKEKKGIF